MLCVLALVAPASAAVAPHPSGVACANATRSPAGAKDARAVRATLCLINAVRRQHGLHTVRLDRQLAVAALGHSRDMVRRRYFAHETPEGLSPAGRVAATGYLRGHRWLVGETLAWWSPNAAPATIVDAWMHSPPHRRVLLEPAFRDVGLGLVAGVPTAGKRGGATYTADFGFRR